MLCNAASIGALEATVSSTVLTIIFVGSLYLPWNRGDRDIAQIVKSRLATLCAITALSEAYVRTRAPRAVYETGANPVLGVAAGLLLTTLLYAGHVLALGVRGLRREAHDVLRRPRWLALRDYALAPLLEELVFRRHSLLIWRCRSLSARVLGPAALFSLAHAHHACRGRLTNAAVQLAYTFVFGAYAAGLVANAGSVWPAIAAHVLCNLLGIPDLASISTHKHQRSITFAYLVAICLVFVFFTPLLRTIAREDPDLL